MVQDALQEASSATAKSYPMKYFIEWAQGKTTRRSRMGVARSTSGDDLEARR